jgi:hypothetical protein
VPSLDLRFAENKSLTDAVTGQSLITFTRASSATYIDSAGTLQTAAVDVPRFDHNPTTGESLGLLVEEQRTNSIRNNTMVGAVAGTPGTIPTNWDIAITGSGITREIVGVGIEDGITYIDIRYFGTGSGSVIPQIRPETTTQIVAAVGQAWTASYYLKVAAGSTAGAFGFSQIWQERDAVGVALNTVTVAIPEPTTAALGTQRNVLTRTLTNAGTARLTNRLQFSFTDGVAIDITLRIGLPQLEQGAFATSVIPTTTATVTRSADVPSITGANFGTTRTNLLLRSEEFDNASWTKSNTTITANSEIAPNGTLAADTLTDTNSAGDAFTRQTVASPVSGATYVASVYLKQGNTATTRVSIDYTGATAVNQDATVTWSTNTTSFGTLQNIGGGWYRLSFSRANNTSGNTNVLVTIRASGDPSGVETGFVYVWGAQLEVGSAVTPYIPTTTAAVSVFESSWYRQDEGTVLVETRLQSTVARNAAGIDLNDNSTNNRLIFRAFTTGSFDQYIARSGGSTVATIASANIPSLLLRKSAIAYRVDDFALTAEGLAPNTDTSGAVPVGVNQAFIGSALSGTEFLGGHIRRLCYWNQRLPNSTLEAITR